jgi:hypothetical protein
MESSGNPEFRSARRPAETKKGEGQAEMIKRRDGRLWAAWHRTIYANLNMLRSSIT